MPAVVDPDPTRAACRSCGNPVERCYRTDHRPLPPAPRRTPHPHVPADACWNTAAGLAHPTAGCQPRICPAQPVDPNRPTTRELDALRRQLAALTHPLTDRQDPGHSSNSPPRPSPRTSRPPPTRPRHWTSQDHRTRRPPRRPHRPRSASRPLRSAAAPGGNRPGGRHRTNQFRRPRAHRRNIPDDRPQGIPRRNFRSPLLTRNGKFPAPR
ncbi:DUF6083 domain-containing protein [Kitasatospora sp. KL5]|uniref:DUF6083 domain-containing protein n=1 Tax=Kitasatospora sp. KL5 TaxID=3425125 RepID=UPI003D6F02DB